MSREEREDNTIYKVVVNHEEQYSIWPADRENLHGHNYKIEIYARGSELNNIGLLVDFGELKEAADEVVRYLDHRNINELPPFDEELNPSAENLARYILERVASRVGDERVSVYKVRCFETPTSVATYQVD